MTATHSNSATVTGMDVVTYFTGDAARSIAFYRDVLGLVPTSVNEQGRGAEFTLADGATFGVWHQDGGPQSGAAVSQFRARGAGLSDPQETPVCFMSFGADPDGNGFMVHQRKPGAA